MKCESQCRIILAVVLSFLIFLTCFTITNASNGEIEKSAASGNGTKYFLDLTEDERSALDEFRFTVKENLTHLYMSRDEYLLRFLMQSKFNITSAQTLILDMLSWRKENNIDLLANEDFPEFETEYSTYLEGCDKSGRPVITVPLGTWDIRSATLAGLAPRLLRFMDKIFEDGTSFLRSVNDLGVELYQATLILDLNGFDMKTHGCPKCIPLYLYFFTTLQTHYPGFVDKIYFVNTPQIVTLIWDVYKDVFTPEIKSMSIIYMMNDANWKKKLLEVIPPSSLSTKLGGYKLAPMEFFHLRTGQNLISSLQDVGAVRVHNNCEKDLGMYETLIREVGGIMERRERILSKARNEVGQDFLGCKTIQKQEFLS